MELECVKGASELQGTSGLRSLWTTLLLCMACTALTSCLKMELALASVRLRSCRSLSSSSPPPSTSITMYTCSWSQASNTHRIMSSFQGSPCGSTPWGLPGGQLSGGLLPGGPWGPTPWGSAHLITEHFMDMDYVGVSLAQL